MCLQFKCMRHVYDLFMDKTFIKHIVDHLHAHPSTNTPLLHFNHNNCYKKIPIYSNILHYWLCFCTHLRLSLQLRLGTRGASVQSTESARKSLETGHVTESAWSPSVSETASTAWRTGASASKTLLSFSLSKMA